jgi:hypothetical protein
LKEKSKFQERDAIVSLILNDPPSRATTPRGSVSTPRGQTALQNRSSLKTPVTAGGRRSQSHDVNFHSGGRRTPPNNMKAMTPRQLTSLDTAFGSGKPPPHMLDILNLPCEFSSVQKSSKLVNIEPGSPGRSEPSSESSLPQLSDKRSQVRRVVKAAPSQVMGVKSARSWRDSATLLYTS